MPDSSIKDEIMQDIAEDIVGHLQHEIVADDLRFTGQLFNSWEITKKPDGTRIIGSPLLWARVMDEGRLPGKMPPVDKLFPWVLDKIKDVKSYQEARQVAFAVAKKIAEKGIEPRHYVRRALFKMEAGS